jgi:hypothetical protein
MKDFGNLCKHSGNHVNFLLIVCVRKTIAERWIYNFWLAPFFFFFFFFFFALQPNLGLGRLHETFVSLQLLDLGQSAGLHGRVISSSQGLCLYTNRKTQPTITAFARAKTVHALDQCSATSFFSGTPDLNCDSYWHTDNITNTLLYYIGMITCANMLVTYCISPFTCITYIRPQNVHILYINTATLFFKPHAIIWLLSHATWVQNFQVWKIFYILKFQNIFKNSKHTCVPRYTGCGTLVWR